jgi:VanZ family protein
MTTPSHDIWKRRFQSWSPPVIWAAVIFTFSTDTFSANQTAGWLEPLLSRLFGDLSPQNIRIIHGTIRKFGHFSEYFVLALLVMRALRQDRREPPPLRHLFLSIALATLYAISDELHQTLVPSRTASAVDVLIDAAGGFCGTLWSGRRRRRKKSTR